MRNDWRLRSIHYLNAHEHYEENLMSLLGYSLRQNGIPDKRVWLPGMKHEPENLEDGIFGLVSSESRGWIIEQWSGGKATLRAINSELADAVVNYYWCSCYRDSPWDDGNDLHHVARSPKSLEHRIIVDLSVVLKRAGVHEDSYVIGKLGDERKVDDRLCLLSCGDGMWITLQERLASSGKKRLVRHAIHTDGIYAGEYFYWMLCRKDTPFTYYRGWHRETGLTL